MTPIQEATYPIIFAGHDLCALAETGSGKTAACAIPLIQKVDPSLDAIQGLVIVPTRELCMQYVEEIRKIAAKNGRYPLCRLWRI
ncbi:DEAD/DEAH box helicase [Candidatus Kuenenia stuttgartensis]|uniref:DEAD/DEAH box helicase n=1 Tax=Kuenenia stuttgartiensis TaxID=174633 RepID=UPI00146C657B|nr:DEAD/DEAH box helicase [Candidatus Kuenenia stuttgartiensis]